MNQSTSFIKRIIRSSKFIGGLAIVSGVLSSSAQTSVGFPGTMITSNAVVNALGYVPASGAVSGTTPAQVTNIVATLSPTNGDTRNFSFPGGAWTFTGSSYLFTTIIDQALAGGSGSSFVLADAGGIPYITNYTFGTAAYSNANAFALSPTNVGTLGQVLSLTGNKTKWVTGSGGTPNYELNWQTDFLTYTNLPDGNLYYRGEVVSGVSSLYFYQNNTPFIAMNGSGFTVSVPVTNSTTLTVSGDIRTSGSYYGDASHLTGIPAGSGSTNTVLILTNFVLNTTYTNVSGGIQLLNAMAYYHTAAVAVNGNATLDLMCDMRGGTTFTRLASLGSDTFVGVTVTMDYTNSIVGVVSNSASYYFTNSSTGSGNSSGLIAGEKTSLGGGPVPDPLTLTTINVTTLNVQNIGELLIQQYMAYDVFSETFGSGSPGSAGTIGQLGWVTDPVGSGASTQPLGTPIAGHYGVQVIETGTTSGAGLGLRFLDYGGAVLFPFPRLDTVTGWSQTYLWKLTATNDMKMFVGLVAGGTLSTTDPANFIGLKLDSTADVHFQHVCRASETSTTANDIGADTNWHTNRIWSDVAGTISFNMDSGATNTISSNVPTTALSPIFYVVKTAVNNDVMIYCDKYLGVLKR